MADISFYIDDPQTNQHVASGMLTVDDNDRVTAITGTINGVNIDGLSTFDNADNSLTFRALFTNGFVYYSNGVDSSGLAFSAGGVNYNIMATPNSNNQPFVQVQSGDNLASSAGTNQTLSFYTSFRIDRPSICFVTGTRIRTHRGNIAVEDLRVGDRAVTASGRRRAITWIGHRDLDSGGTPLHHDQAPVRVRANAFGPGVPERDLRLSPGHPVLVGADPDNDCGVLVPIMCLINGTTIARQPAIRVTYWHVELDAHDILLAEGLPAESYIDLGSRPWFAGADHVLLDPDMALTGMPGRCRPVAVDGPVIGAERQRLDAVFSAQLTAACAWPGGSITAP